MKREQSDKREKKPRKGRRFKTRKLVRAHYRGKQLPLGNLSLSGALIRMPNPLAVGKELKLQLVSEQWKKPIDVTAVVRRIEEGRGIGVEFTQFHNGAEQELQQLLGGLSPERILVVDDDEGIRRMLQFALRSGNYEVETAADGTEGLQKVLEWKPDLVVLDLGLPGLSGLEVCQRVRTTPELAKLPILILSATTDVTDVTSAQQLGAVLFAPKPIQPQQFMNLVRMLLER
ncbi:MAG: response regulator [Terriglobia bacterium]